MFPFWSISVSSFISLCSLTSFSRSQHQLKSKHDSTLASLPPSFSLWHIFLANIWQNNIKLPLLKYSSYDSSWSSTAAHTTRPELRCTQRNQRLTLDFNKQQELRVLEQQKGVMKFCGSFPSLKNKESNVQTRRLGGEYVTVISLLQTLIRPKSMHKPYFTSWLWKVRCKSWFRNRTTAFDPNILQQTPAAERCSNQEVGRFRLKLTFWIRISSFCQNQSFKVF